MTERPDFHRSDTSPDAIRIRPPFEPPARVTVTANTAADGVLDAVVDEVPGDGGHEAPTGPSRRATMLTWITIAVAAWGSSVGVAWPLIVVLVAAAVGWRRYLPGWIRAFLAPTLPDEPTKPPSLMVRALLTAANVYLVLYLVTELVAGGQSLADWAWFAVPALIYFVIVWVVYLRVERSWQRRGATTTPRTTPRRPSC